MKSNTEIARTAFRYCGGIAALFILFTGRLQAQQTKTEEKPVRENECSLLHSVIIRFNTGDQ